jgi:outer membrane lipoprotein-sorting protein
MTQRNALTWLGALVALAVLLGIAPIGSAQEPQPAYLTPTEILDRVRTTWQGDSFHATISLEVVLGGQTKSHVLEVWTLGDEYALVRVHEPADDAGSGYLQINDELWYYSPQVGSAIKLPSLALGDALFGSGPSIEDLSLGTLSEDYDVTGERLDAGYLLTLTPHSDAPVVYGKLELTVSTDFIIEKLVTYDQRGEVLQTSTFSDPIEIDGQTLPTRIEIEDASGDRTVEQISNPEYNLDIDASFFTLARLEAAE